MLRSIHFLILIISMAALLGCDRSYYSGELKPSDLVGKWTTFNPQGSSGKHKTDVREVDLVLYPDGQFEAKKLPWTNLKDRLEYVDEVGEWKLRDISSDGLRSRWKLSMRLAKHHQTVEWDLFASEQPTPLIGLIYDLDSNACALFEKMDK